MLNCLGRIFTSVTPHDPDDSLLRTELLLPPFYSWGDGSAERLSDLPSHMAGKWNLGSSLLFPEPVCFSHASGGLDWFSLDVL